MDWLSEVHGETDHRLFEKTEHNHTAARPHHTESRTRPANHTDGDQRARLACAVVSEIIPRLMLAHRSADEPITRDGAYPAPVVTPDVVNRFTSLLLENNHDHLSTFVQALRRGGISFETLCLEVFTPAAQKLGVLWEQDLCDFSDVTIGMGQLHRLLHLTSTSPGVSRTLPEQSDSVVLAPVPGEQHTFGLTMLGAMFRDAGWTVDDGPVRSLEDLLDSVRDRDIAVIGLSIAAEAHLAELAQAVTALRSMPRLRHTMIVIGGALAPDHPELARTVGADAVALSAQHAVSLVAQRHGAPHTPT